MDRDRCNLGCSLEGNIFLPHWLADGILDSAGSATFQSPLINSSKQKLNNHSVRTSFFFKALQLNPTIGEGCMQNWVTFKQQGAEAITKMQLEDSQ